MAFWYGGKLVRDGEINAGDILISLFAVMIGFSAVGQSVSHVQRMSAGQVAAASIFSIIDRQPLIDNISEEGWVPEKEEGFKVRQQLGVGPSFFFSSWRLRSRCLRLQLNNPSPLLDCLRCIQGTIEFENVGFAYGGSSDRPVLQGLSFRADRGETVAIVGPSGSGKSTVVALLERFYDPTSGQIRIDGRDLKVCF